MQSTRIEEAIPLARMECRSLQDHFHAANTRICRGSERETVLLMKKRTQKADTRASAEQSVENEKKSVNLIDIRIR